MSRKRAAPALAAVALSLGVAGCGETTTVAPYTASAYGPVAESAAESAKASKAAERRSKEAAERRSKEAAVQEAAGKKAAAAQAQREAAEEKRRAAAAAGQAARRAAESRAAQQGSRQRSDQAARDRQSPQTSGSSSAPGGAASRINLKAADLPGYQTGSPSQSSRADEQFARCVGGTPPTSYRSKASSPTFSRGDVTFHSEVSVLPTAAALERDYRAWTGPDYRRCLKTLFAEGAGMRNAQMKVSTARVPLRCTGLDACFWYRHEAVISGPNGSMTMSFDMVGLGERSTSVGLSAVSLGGKVPGREVARLIGTLAERTRRHAV